MINCTSMNTCQSNRSYSSLIFIEYSKSSDEEIKYLGAKYILKLLYSLLSYTLFKAYAALQKTFGTFLYNFVSFNNSPHVIFVAPATQSATYREHFVHYLLVRPSVALCFCWCHMHQHINYSIVVMQKSLFARRTIR